MEQAVVVSDIVKSELKLKNKYSRLFRIQQLQKSIVRQNMHNVMSPLSAISGYLDLIGMTLEEEPNKDQIDFYRRQIETGISEVNEILGQLHEVYKSEGQNDEEFLEVDLNWTVREVCRQIKSTKKTLIFEDTFTPVFIKTSLYTAKLIIYKLLLYAIKSSENKEKVIVSTEEENGRARLNISFNASIQKAKEIEAVFGCENEKDEFECIKQNSLIEGLMASYRLTSQIGGQLEFQMINDQKDELSLYLPLA